MFWFWFRLFGREWVFEQWCKWSEVSPWEVVREDIDDGHGSKQIWVGPFSLIISPLEPLPGHVEGE